MTPEQLALKAAINRIEDMLSDDDGQAFKEARKFLPVGRAALAALRSMPAEPVAYSVTYNGDHVGNVYGEREHAEDRMAAMNEKHPQDERTIIPLYATPHTEAKPAKDAVDAAIPLDKDEVAQLIAEHLGGTYHCTRVWEAWNVGTMSQDDFEPVDESETPTEIADAIIDAIRAAISAKKGGVSLTHIPEPAAFQLPEGMHALYTQQAPAQQPLTDEQIQDLLGIGNPAEEECRLIRLGWEAANGIGGEKP